MSHTDFNDLFKLAGLDAVRQQLRAGLAAANDAALPSPTPPPLWPTKGA